MGWSQSLNLQCHFLETLWDSLSPANPGTEGSWSITEVFTCCSGAEISQSCFGKHDLAESLTHLLSCSKQVDPRSIAHRFSSQITLSPVGSTVFAVEITLTFPRREDLPCLAAWPCTGDVSSEGNQGVGIQFVSGKTIFFWTHALWSYLINTTQPVIWYIQSISSSEGSLLDRAITTSLAMKDDKLIVLTLSQCLEVLICSSKLIFSMI